MPARPIEAPVELTPAQILSARKAAIARGDFSELTDAEVMLELRSGNLAAFDVLLAKYRKPIVHFMFRMVHNQAVAEELAQEVFPAGLPLAGDVPCRSPIQHLVVQDRDQSGCEPCPRHSARTLGLDRLSR